MDFSIFYKEEIENGNFDSLPNYDLYISAFDQCERTYKIYDNVNSKEKIWLVFPQHQIDIKNNSILNSHHYYYDESYNEDDYFLRFINNWKYSNSIKICIDITGFLRPHLLFLIKFLFIKRYIKIDFIYTEPVQYRKADETIFSGFIDHIDTIQGYSSSIINSQTDNDILIINAGYDDNLIAKIAQDKNHCKKKYFILGFPSLQPDMYQESILKIEKVKESIGENKIKKFAPAYDPFITAQVINDIIENNPNATNIYLSPLSTKPQTIGMCLYYLWFYQDKPISIIFPYSNRYSTKHSIGINRTWRYTFELPKEPLDTTKNIVHLEDSVKNQDDNNN